MSSPYPPSARGYAVAARSALERRVHAQLDVALERLADRAPVACFLGQRLKPVGVDARDVAPDGEIAVGDTPAGVQLVEADHGGDVEPVRRRSVLREPVRERHREAGGVRRGDELLGARLTFGAGGP